MDDWNTRATQFIETGEPLTLLPGRFHLTNTILAFPLPQTSLYGPGFERLHSLPSALKEEKDPEKAYVIFWNDKKDVPIGRGVTEKDAVADLRRRCAEFIQSSRTFQGE